MSPLSPYYFIHFQSTLTSEHDNSRPVPSVGDNSKVVSEHTASLAWKEYEPRAGYDFAMAGVLVYRRQYACDNGPPLLAVLACPWRPVHMPKAGPTLQLEVQLPTLAHDSYAC